MNNPEKENLNRLFETFLDAEAAKQAAEDIEQGDKLLSAFPAPLPGDGTILKVKDKVAAELKRRRVVTMQWQVLSAVGVAAAVIAGFFLSAKFFNPAVETPRPAIIASAIPDRIWEGSDITSDDADLAVLSAEIETVKNTLAGIQINEIVQNGESTVGDLEMELIEISTDIWKG